MKEIQLYSEKKIFYKQDIENYLDDNLKAREFFTPISSPYVWPDLLTRKHVWFFLGAYIHEGKDKGLIEEVNENIRRQWPFHKLIKPKYIISLKGLAYQRVKLDLLHSGIDLKDYFKYY